MNYTFILCSWNFDPLTNGQVSFPSRGQYIYLKVPKTVP